MKTVASARRLMDLGVNMLGYGEIQVDTYNASYLMNTYGKEFHLKKQLFDEAGFEVLHGTESSTPFMGVVLKDKSHVYLALKEFLRKERPFG
jgi:hypothetical protein